LDFFGKVDSGVLLAGCGRSHGMHHDIIQVEVDRIADAGAKDLWCKAVKESTSSTVFVQLLSHLDSGAWSFSGSVSILNKSLSRTHSTEFSVRYIFEELAGLLAEIFG
jgi:hypothetical protein